MIVRESPDGLVCQAPAKLNLFLEVLGKRQDGYHELETLMVTVDLHDTLSCVDDPSGRIVLRCDDPSLPTGPENLVVQAAERLRRDAGIDRGATITLSKAIPAQAGLGGGSSDAATTLRALDRLWNLQTPSSRMNALAAEIGSDVAFFLNPPAAVCRGRGEQVEPIRLPNPFFVVLICPPVGCSTAAVYQRLAVPERPRSIGPVLEALIDGDPEALGRSLFNRLQPVAEKLVPDLRRARESLEALGSALAGHLMSGSGSAYFGLARDRTAAEAAACQLKSLGLGQVRVVTCGP